MALFAAPIDLVGGARAHRAAGHMGALVTVGALVAVLETQAATLDHGTHLLLALVAVLATAVVLGPWPAASGLVAGAILAAAASALGVAGVSGAAVQVPAFLLVGSATIALAAVAARSRRPSPSVPATSRAEVLPQPVATASTGSLYAPERPPADRSSSAAPRMVGPADGLVEVLTAREAEVLRMAATGVSVDVIASRLGVSPNTVKTHLTHLYAKLGVRGRTDAVRAALHAGWLAPGDICPHHFGGEGEIHRFR